MDFFNGLLEVRTAVVSSYPVCLWAESHRGIRASSLRPSDRTGLLSRCLRGMPVSGCERSPIFCRNNPVKRLMEFLGLKTARFLLLTHSMYEYFRRLLGELPNVYFYRRQIVEQCYSVGVNSLSLVILVSAFSGMAVSTMMAYQMEDYVPDYMVGSIVVRSVLLELAPILMGLVLAGQVGAGIASEVGTMKVSEQVDALVSLAVDPVGYLLMPRVLAGIVMIPVLVVFSAFTSIYAGYVMSILLMDITVADFVKGMKLDFSSYDLVVCLIKSVVYGGLITFYGSFSGLSATGGAQGVGRAATSAVVISAASILILDYFLTKTLLY